MDPTGGHAHEENFNPLGESSGDAEEPERHSSRSDHLSNHGVFVTDLDVHFVVEVKDLVFHQLELPSGILAATHADCRPPFLKVYSNDDEGVHAFEETRICVVGQMSFNQVQFEKTKSTYYWINHYRWSFHYHLRRLCSNDLVHNLRCELGCEMNSASGLSSEEQFKPLGSASWNCEKVDSDSYIAKGLCYPRFSISHFDLNLVFHVKYLDIHKLKHPAWISAAALANNGSPLSSVYSNQDVRVHSFKQLVRMVKVSLLEM